MKHRTPSETKTCSECCTPRLVSQFLPARNGRRISRCIVCIKRAAQRHRERAAAVAKSVRQSRRARPTVAEGRLTGKMAAAEQTTEIDPA